MSSRGTVPYVESYVTVFVLKDPLGKLCVQFMGIVV